MAGLLSFSDYLGGPDNVQVIELFPSSQKTFQYSFGQDITGWTFTADYQSILLDQIAYDRNTGDPNFTNTTVSGYFTGVSNVSANLISVSNTTTGNVSLTIPANRYTGNILPNSRANVVMTVLSFQWQTDTTPAEIDLHRWAILERYEPDVPIGNPRNEPTFVSLA